MLYNIELCGTKFPYSSLETAAKTGHKKKKCRTDRENIEIC